MLDNDFFQVLFVAGFATLALWVITGTQAHVVLKVAATVAVVIVCRILWGRID